MKRSERYFLFLKDVLRRDGEFGDAWKRILWEDFFAFSGMQAILGVALDGMRQLGARLDGHIDENFYLEWVTVGEIIKQQNQLLNQRAVEVMELFRQAGFNACILKGQGNALMYDDPYSRTPGDIDVWVVPKGMKGDEREARKVVTDFVRSHCPDAKGGWLHIQFPIFDDVEVEVHYTPSIASRPLHERRLKQFFASMSAEQFSHEVCLPETEGTVCVPTPAFNVVQQLSHLMKHFFVEGVGLRQFIDFYYVLKALHNEPSKAYEWEKELSHLGMLKFARAVMWMEEHCLGLERQYMIVDPDEKTGRLLLSEMLQGGNFGQSDRRFGARDNGQFNRDMADLRRLLKLWPTFPSEVMWKVVGTVMNRWRI